MALVQKQFSDLITFSRASGGGRFNHFGQYEWLAANNTPRFGFDPATVSTSTSSVAIGAGQLTFAVTRQYALGEIVRATADASNYVVGKVIAATSISVTLLVDSDGFTGSGTFSSWTLIVSRGLLIEEQRTNLLTYSAQFDNAAWVKVNAAVTNGGLSPDGISSWKTITASGTSYPRASQTVALSSGHNTFSIYIAAGSVAYIQGTVEVSGTNTLRFFADIATQRASVRIDVGSITGGATLVSVGNGAYRLCVDVNVPAAGNYNVFFGPGSGYQITIANIGDSINVWGAQLEIGSFPTSYIPAGSSQVTRVADVASMNALSPWFNQQAGSVVIQGQYLFSPERVGIRSGLIRIDDGSDNNYLDFSRDQNNTGLNGRLFEGATNNMVPASASVGTAPFTLAAAWSVGGMLDISVNGAAARNNGYNQTFAAFTRFLIGTSTRVSSWQMNGHIKSIRYYPKRLTDTELQGLTA